MFQILTLPRIVPAVVCIWLYAWVVVILSSLVHLHPCLHNSYKDSLSQQFHKLMYTHQLESNYHQAMDIYNSLTWDFYLRIVKSLILKIGMYLDLLICTQIRPTPPPISFTSSENTIWIIITYHQYHNPNTDNALQYKFATYASWTVLSKNWMLLRLEIALPTMWGSPISTIAHPGLLFMNLICRITENSQD